ncbi:MAG: hypothetical protein HY744_08640 [Deltaproteobacteria bacterium]|nr:hypothetical protein [Deltaproteobacteria bacterium]
MGLTRRQISTAARWLAAGAAAALAACGSTETLPGADAGPRDCSDQPPAIQIQFNHGHALQVPKADVAAGEPKTYDIRGSADHAHEANLSANDFTQLRRGVTVTTPSTKAPDGHNHAVTLVCP